MPTFADGDRVEAKRRVGFPRGTVVKTLENGFVLVHWDGDVLETAHGRELVKVTSRSSED